MSGSRAPHWTAIMLGFALAAAAPLASSIPSVLFAQQQSPVPPQPGVTPSLAPSSSLPQSEREHMDAQRNRMAEDDRHKRLATDADRLVQLSNELKAAVDKNGKDELSMDVIRKAVEIEKLARDLQSHEKN
jgi:hypothetical protein